MKATTPLVTAILVAVAQSATANCNLVDDIAATSYGKANEALSKGWSEAAFSAAYFFWYVHDLADCNLTKAMASHMTRAGLVKGTAPTGPTTAPSSKILVSVPSTANFAQASGSFIKGMYAPETLFVNGATYKLQSDAASAAVSKATIEEFLRDSSKSSLGGFAVDKDVLQQWKTVPVSPTPTQLGNVPGKAGG